MPHSLSADYLSHLAGHRVNLATCIKVTPAYGGPIGFTSHDTDLVYGGVTYDPDKGVQIETFANAIGTEIQAMRMTGILGTHITVNDLVRYWEGAAVELFNLTWDNLARGRQVWAKGRIGNIVIESQTSFKAEFRDATDKLAVVPNRVMGERCPWVFGGAECGKNLATLTRTATVSFVSADGLTLRWPASGVAAGKLVEGWIKALGGNNVGVPPIPIKDNRIQTGQDEVFLYAPFPMPLLAGTQVEFVEGCNGTKQRCDELGQTLNFGGFPNLMGQIRRDAVGGAN